MLDSLIRAGMRHVIVSPGSRAPLCVPIAAAAEPAPWLRTCVWTERGAAFTALGIAKASGQPVGLVHLRYGSGRVRCPLSWRRTTPACPGGAELTARSDLR